MKKTILILFFLFPFFYYQLFSQDLNCPDGFTYDAKWQCFKMNKYFFENTAILMEDEDMENSILINFILEGPLGHQISENIFYQETDFKIIKKYYEFINLFIDKKWRPVDVVEKAGFKGIVTVKYNYSKEKVIIITSKENKKIYQFYSPLEALKFLL